MIPIQMRFYQKVITRFPIKVTNDWNDEVIEMTLKGKVESSSTGETFYKTFIGKK